MTTTPGAVTTLTRSPGATSRSTEATKASSIPNALITVPSGHTYVVVFRQGSAAGKTLGILTVNSQTGDTAFYLPKGSPGVDLGSITITPQLGKATCGADPFLPSDTMKLQDSDADGIPDVCDNSADEDGDGIADVDDPEAFAPLKVASLKDVPVPEPVNLGLFLRSAAGVNAASDPCRSRSTVEPCRPAMSPTISSAASPSSANCIRTARCRGRRSALKLLSVSCVHGPSRRPRIMAIPRNMDWSLRTTDWQPYCMSRSLAASS